MARRPFFSGNYGSALGSFDTAARLIAQAGQTQGQAMANIGRQIGDTIEEYQLNKVKRKKLEGEIEAYYEQNREELTNIGMSGDEEKDKKDFLQREKFVKGNMSMAELEGLAGKLARGDTIKARKQLFEANQIANQQAAINLGIANELKDTRIQIEQDKGVLSRLAKDLVEETNPQKIELLQAQMRDAIDNLGLGDTRRDAERSELLLRQEKADEGLKALPGETSNILKAQQVKSKQLDVESDIFDILGVSELAQMKADDLKTLSETNRAKLEQSKAYAGYLRNKGLADLVTAANKSSSTFKDRFAPLVEIGGKLLTTNVVVPGSNKRVPFKEYLELNEENSTKYPMNGMPGDLFAQLQAIEKSQQEVLRDQKVQVDVPDEATVPTVQTQSVDIGRQTPQQAIQTLTSEIAEIRQRIPQINAELQSLGQSGQTMPAAPQVPMGQGGFAVGTVDTPQTVNFIEQQRIALPQERSQLQARLEQLEAKRQELESQLRVR